MSFLTNASGTTSGSSSSSGLAPIMLGLAAIQGASQIFGGASTASSASKEAALTRQEGALAQQELEAQARKTEYEGQKFAGVQTMKYAKSGVLATEGSPLIILDETRRLVQEEADALRKRGAAMRRVAMGRASVINSQGRNSLLGGLAGAVGTGFSTLLYGKQAGLWGNSGAASQVPYRIGLEGLEPK